MCRHLPSSPESAESRVSRLHPVGNLLALSGPLSSEKLSIQASRRLNAKVNVHELRCVLGTRGGVLLFELTSMGIQWFKQWKRHDW
jgi:hypothetical protein